VFAKIDTEQEQALSQSFGIRSIPTTIAFKQGIGVFMMPGALPEKDLRELIVKLGEIDMDEVRAAIEAEDNAAQSVEIPE
jgi:thioredoxin 1